MNQENKWIFIINPVAGGGFAATMKDIVAEMASKHKINSEIVLTAKRGDAAVMAAKYASLGYRYIIGIGGDGTFNEIGSALVNMKNVITGLIPAGTGNDFIQILGFPDRFAEKDWNNFFMAETIAMDAGNCNGLYFFNGMGLGFDAAVAAENYTPPGEVKSGGKYKYIWHILKTILFYNERRMRTINNGELKEIDCFMNTVANGRRFAGGFLITPEAIANDSLLDVCLVERISVPRRLRILTMVPKGTHTGDIKVHYYKTDSLRLEFDEKVPFHLDGELHFSESFDIRVISSSLNIIYDPSGKHFFNTRSGLFS
jgi:YegS/Rv2252/BmrU family lipid kinase